MLYSHCLPLLFARLTQHFEAAEALSKIILDVMGVGKMGEAVGAGARVLDPLHWGEIRSLNFYD